MSAFDYGHLRRRTRRKAPQQTLPEPVRSIKVAQDPALCATRPLYPQAAAVALRGADATLGWRRPRPSWGAGSGRRK